MKRIPIELKSKAMTSHVPLAVFGYVLGRTGVLSPLDEVALPIKTLDHSPVEKLIEAVVLILAGGRATSQADLLLRPNRWLARGWGQGQFAQQATLADTLDAFDQSSIASLRTAFEMILQTHSAALSHDYRCGDLWLDGDLTGLPASRRAEGSTKGYFAGKKTVLDANGRAYASGPMARHWGLCSIPARNTRSSVCNRWCYWRSV
jgi:hypothetical protein